MMMTMMMNMGSFATVRETLRPDVSSLSSTFSTSTWGQVGSMSLSMSSNKSDNQNNSVGWCKSSPGTSRQRLKASWALSHTWPCCLLCLACTRRWAWRWWRWCWWWCWILCYFVDLQETTYCPTGGEVRPTRTNPFLTSCRWRRNKVNSLLSGLWSKKFRLKQVLQIYRNVPSNLLSKCLEVNYLL